MTRLTDARHGAEPARSMPRRNFGEPRVAGHMRRVASSATIGTLLLDGLRRGCGRLRAWRAVARAAVRRARRSFVGDDRFGH